MRCLSLLPLVLCVTTAARAQGAIGADLWRIAAGAHVVPGPLADDGLAAFWTPAVTLPDSVRVRVGIATIQTPEELGVTGAQAAVLVRTPAGTLAFSWGRMGLDDIARTETSPEAVGGPIPVHASVFSVGFGRLLGPALRGGIAARVLSGQLDDLRERRLGIDAGVQYAGLPRTRLGAATRFADPRLVDGSHGAALEAAAEHRLPPFPLGGTPASVRLRYGVTVQSGESPQHHATAGILLGDRLALDAGTAREAVAGGSIWRSRGALSIAAGHYRVAVARDGGLNGFGATWSFSLTADLP